jgi:AcrR family transcriptional regulator
MSNRARVERPGQSSLRREPARSARADIIEAAGRLFIERGYAPTSVDDVADAAGVSRATVFSAVGGKPMLLKTAFDVALVGDDEPVSLAERPRSRAIRQERDQRRYLERYAELVAEIGRRLSELHEVVRAAAADDPDARYLWDQHRAQRRRAAADVVRDLSARDGGLREGLDEEAAADVVWLLNDPSVYHQLVRERSWTSERFEAWLADTLRCQLLLPGPW